MLGGVVGRHTENNGTSGYESTVQLASKMYYLNTILGCPAALYSLMSHEEVDGEQKIDQLYMPSYQNRSCSLCLQDVYLTFLDN